MKTLFVDDNEASRFIMASVLHTLYPNGTHISAECAADALEILNNETVDVIFLDIEMPGINGIVTAHYLESVYPRLNVIFVTGHPEYALDALKVHCSGFIEKPFDEDDVKDALAHLRYPIEEKPETPLRVRCTDHFAVFLNDVQFTFKRKLTMELFAYLVYKNGAMCTNGELIGILWEGDSEKASFLRQLIKDMRDCFENAGIDDIIVRRHGSVGLNTYAYILEGDPNDLCEQFCWI